MDVPSSISRTPEDSTPSIIDILSTKLQSPPEEHLDEDEKLARKLQQMEVAEAQAQSLHPLQSQASYQSIRRSASPRFDTPQLQGSAAPQPYSQSTHFESARYSQAETLQVARYDHGDLAPEVVTPTIPWSRAAVAPEVVPSHMPWSPAAIAPEVVTPAIALGPSATAPEVVKPSLLEITSAHLPPPPMDPSHLSAYLETYRQVPYPSQWALPKVIETLYASFQCASPSDWLDTLGSTSWQSSRCGHARGKAENPVFTFSFKSKGGKFRDPQISWAMTHSQGPKKLVSRKQIWNYLLRIDLRTNVRSYEMLTTPDGKAILCTYVHALNYDTLRFVGPDGRGYKWVTQGPVTTMMGARYDMLRHALFASIDGKQDPLFGQIVADHAYWDGFTDRRHAHERITCLGCRSEPLIGLRWKCRVCKDHNVCEACWISKASIRSTCDLVLVSLPDETLHIRSDSVDVGMVVATLQIVKEWEKITLREERRRDPGGFRSSVENIRRGNLGRMSYWRSSDFEGLGD